MNLIGLLAIRVPEDVVIGAETHRRFLVDPQVVLPGRHAVVDPDAIEDRSVRRRAFDREAIHVVAVRDVAEVLDAARIQLIEPVIAIVPGQILDREAVVGTALDLKPAVLIVVEPVALDEIAGRIVDEDADRLARRGVRVSERLVVLDRAVRARDVAVVRDVNAVIAVEGNHVLLDQHVAAPRDVDAILGVVRDRVIADHAIVRAAPQADGAVIGARGGKAVDRHPRAAAQVERVCTPSHQDLVRAGLPPPTFT